MTTPAEARSAAAQIRRQGEMHHMFGWSAYLREAADIIDDLAAQLNGKVTGADGAQASPAPVMAETVDKPSAADSFAESPPRKRRALVSPDNSGFFS